MSWLADHVFSPFACLSFSIIISELADPANATHGVVALYNNHSGFSNTLVISELPLLHAARRLGAYYSVACPARMHARSRRASLFDVLCLSQYMPMQRRNERGEDGCSLSVNSFQRLRAV